MQARGRKVIVERKAAAVNGLGVDIRQRGGKEARRTRTAEAQI